VVASVSAQFKEMLDIDQTGHGKQKHHNEGNITLVNKIKDILETDMINPFRDQTPDLINISTGQKVPKEVMQDLVNAKQVGINAIEDCLAKKEKKITNIKLRTFQDQKKQKPGSQQQKSDQLSNDVVILKRLLQLNAAGQDIDLDKTIGEFECCSQPPSLFEADGTMRHGNKATWLTSILSETQVTSLEELPQTGKKTATIVDTMCFIQQNRFRNDETFDEYQTRCLKKIIRDIPPNCHYVHIPGDRYDNIHSRKKGERERRSQMLHKGSKEYEIKGSLKPHHWNISSSMKRIKQPFKIFFVHPGISKINDLSWRYNSVPVWRICRYCYQCLSNRG
jgi:hypothetical protein